MRIHPPACQNSWRHTHPQKHPFQWSVIITHLFNIDAMAPLRSERCHALETGVDICPQIHAVQWRTGLPTPTNTFPSKPRPTKSPQTQTQTHAYHARVSQPQNMFCTVSHRQLQSIQPLYPLQYPLPKPASRTAQPPQTQTPAKRTRGESITTVSHVPHGT